MIQDTTPISLVMRTNIYSFSDDERKRREGALKNKDFYYGRQEQYLSLINEDVDPVAINLVNPIVTKRSSLLYNRPLVREFDGPEYSVKTLEDIYYKLKIDTILQQVDLAAELTGTCLVFVGLDENDEIILIPYDASNFSAVTLLDNKTIEALQIISINDLVTENGKSVQVKRVLDSEVWTNSYVHKLRDGIQYEQPVANDLGFIPFVPFKAQEVISQFLGHSPTTNIRQLNGYYNQQLTHLGYMVKMQSATPIVLSGFSNGESVSIHPGTAISLPAGAGASSLGLDPKVTEALEVIRYIEEKMYQTSSVPKISIVGDIQGTTSGVELMIRWAPLASVFHEKANRYQQYELQLANMILDVLGLERIVDVKVNYPKDAVLPVDTDRQNLEQDIKLGIRTPIDEILKTHQNLDETGAEALVLANLEFNKQIQERLDVRPNNQSE